MRTSFCDADNGIGVAVVPASGDEAAETLGCPVAAAWSVDESVCDNPGGCNCDACDDIRLMRAMK